MIEISLISFDCTFITALWWKRFGWFKRVKNAILYMMQENIEHDTIWHVNIVLLAPIDVHILDTNCLISFVENIHTLQW